MTIRERQRVERLYRSMSVRELTDLRAAFVLDRRAAHGGQRTVRFCDERIALIDQAMDAKRGRER